MLAAMKNTNPATVVLLLGAVVVAWMVFTKKP